MQDPMEKTLRCALLIDADNVSTQVVQQVLGRLAGTQRQLQHRRAYGSVQKAGEFGEFCKEHAIRFLPSTFAGPNATDIALAIDAVELVLRQPLDEVVIVSSDMDYAPLVVRLRELGCRVRGFGQHGKSASNVERDYERVYDEFEVIEPPQARPAARRAPPKPEPAAEAPTRPRAAAKSRRAAPAPRATAVSATAPRAAPAPALRAAAPAPAPLPEAVRAVLAACPALQRGELVRLNGVAESLRDAGILKKNSKSTSLFKKLASHFELLPPNKPETVRLLAR